MTVDVGIQATYLDRAKAKRDQLRDDLQHNLGLQAEAQFQQTATASLSTGDITILTQLQVLESLNLATLRSQEQVIRGQIQALQNFIQAVRAL